MGRHGRAQALIQELAVRPWRVLRSPCLGSPSNGGGTTAHRFRVPEFPESSVSSVGSEVKTIMEVGPSGVSSQLPTTWPPQ